MRILVPVDGSTPSRSVLQFVSDRAKQMPVMPVVQLLTVEPPVPSSGIGTMMELEAVRSAFAAEGERVLESLLPIAGGIPLYRAVVYGRLWRGDCQCQRHLLRRLNCHGYARPQGRLPSFYWFNIALGARTCRTPAPIH